MLLDLIFIGLYKIVDFIVTLLPNLDAIQIPDGITSALEFFSINAGYFIPMGDLAIIFTIYIVVTNFRFFYNLIVKIWELLPFT